MCNAIVKSLEREIALLQTKDTLEKDLLQNQFTYQDNIENAEDILDLGLRQQAKALSTEILRTQNMKPIRSMPTKDLRRQWLLLNQEEQDAGSPA